jgi:hypothetical protein
VKARNRRLERRCDALENARRNRQLRDDVVCKLQGDSAHNWQLKDTTHGNPRFKDPLKRMELAPNVGIAGVMRQLFPAIVDICFFWNTILVGIGEVPVTIDIPIRFAGRNTAWFRHGFRIGFQELLTDHDGCTVGPVLKVAAARIEAVDPEWAMGMAKF